MARLYKTGLDFCITGSILMHMTCETCQTPTCESCGGCKCPGNECLCKDIFSDKDEPAAEKTLEDVEI